MTAQIEPHHPVLPGEMRDPGEIAPGAAHRRMQHQDGRRALPRVGKIVDVIRETLDIDRRRISSSDTKSLAKNFYLNIFRHSHASRNLDARITRCVRELL